LPPRSPEQLLRRAYEAFNARDIDAALALMDPDVDWPNGMEGGREVGHDAVRAYWTRQWQLIDPQVEPESFSEDEDGRVVVLVHQLVRDLDGGLVADQRVEHVYTLRDGLIERMDIGDASVVAHPPKPRPAPPPTPGIGSPETRGGGNGKRR
jgi:ketosteroid isomerase-like protein